METSQYLKTSTITVISIPKPFYSKSDFLHRTSDSIARLKEVRNGNISVLENITTTVISIPKPFYNTLDSFARLKVRNGNIAVLENINNHSNIYSKTFLQQIRLFCET